MKTQVQRKPQSRLRALALYCALAIPVLPLATTPAAATGIPTVDAAAIAQNILQVMESIQHTVSLMEQYETQLQQFEYELMNTMAPAAYIWEQTEVTMSKLQAAQALLNVYGNQLDYFEKYLDPEFYKASHCYSLQGCTEAEWAALEDIKEQMGKKSAEQNKAHAALAQGVLDKTGDTQKHIKTIENQAAAAQGQMQALAANNQFASVQSRQLADISQQLASINLLLARQHAEAQTQKEEEKKYLESMFSVGNIK